MMETLKSLRRRWCEDQTGIFPWRSIFAGRMLDIGAGDCKLPFDGCVSFDVAGADVNGDANQITKYFRPESFDLVHSSQCLEHLHSPTGCLKDWLSLLKPGGHLIVTIPDFDLYEKRCHPSRFNGDHKAVFSLWRKGFPGLNGKLYHVPTMLEQAGGEIKLCRLVTTNFDWAAPEDKDQTFIESDGVECWIEICLKKL